MRIRKKVLLLHTAIPKSPGGGIGRRARFRCVCRKACRFDSCPGHWKPRWRKLRRGFAFSVSAPHPLPFRQEERLTGSPRPKRLVGKIRRPPIPEKRHLPSPGTEQTRHDAKGTNSARSNRKAGCGDRSAYSACSVRSATRGTRVGRSRSIRRTSPFCRNTTGTAGNLSKGAPDRRNPRMPREGTPGTSGCQPPQRTPGKSARMKIETKTPPIRPRETGLRTKGLRQAPSGAEISRTPGPLSAHGTTNGGRTPEVRPPSHDPDVLSPAGIRSNR